MSAVRTRNLSRKYKGGVLALDSVSLDIEEGEVRGLLGPNGAGKTTLTKILSTVLVPSSGSAEVLGHDVVQDRVAVRRAVGVVFGGERGLYPHLSGRQNLELWAAVYDVPRDVTKRRIGNLAGRLDLTARLDSTVSTYSRGMKQRLHLARGLIADARVLLLDEPTVGMDPVAARNFRGLVSDLRAQEKTILMATHDMGEAEALCDTVALVDHGRLLAVETPSSLARLAGVRDRIDISSAPEELLAKVRAHSGVTSVRDHQEGGYRIELSDAAAHLAVLSMLVASGISSVRTSRPSLEEVYLYLLGERAKG